MAKGSVGRAGDASTGMIIPVGQQKGSTRKIFPNLLDAISQIQQFYVIEVSGEEIPDDFLTLRGKLNFFNVGFGAGFVEALVFTLLLTFALVVVSDNGLRGWLNDHIPLMGNSVFLWILNLSPVIISAGLCCFLSKYHIGKITKSAVDMLLLGRLFSLVVKGLILFFVLTYLAEVITPTSAWAFAKKVTGNRYEWTAWVYQVLLTMKPFLVKRAFEVLGIFALGVIAPFVTIWGVSWARRAKAARDRAMMED